MAALSTAVEIRRTTTIDAVDDRNIGEHGTLGTTSAAAAARGVPLDAAVPVATARGEVNADGREASG